MYKINDTASLYLYRVKKACQKCDKEVSFDQKFCGVCGSPLDTPAKDVNNEVIVRHELEDVGKACTAILAKKYGVRLKEKASISVVGRVGKNYATSVGKYDLCCEKCGEPIHLYQSFCTECGTQLNVPDELTTELSWEEVEAIILAKFYEQNPTLRPKQEQKYHFSVAVYRKWNDSADFADAPFIFLSAQSTKDKIHGIADLNEDTLDVDDEATMLVESDVGEFFKVCIEDHWLDEEFREEKVVEKTCSLGDKHEFLIIVSINEVK
jgi:RNA polymerase subunit RPABC4/transcription elongation factor Spt4